MERNEIWKANKNISFTVCNWRWLTWTILGHICVSWRNLKILTFYYINTNFHDHTNWVSTHFVHHLDANIPVKEGCSLVLRTLCHRFIRFTVRTPTSATVPICFRCNSCPGSTLIALYGLIDGLGLAHHVTVSLCLWYEHRLLPSPIFDFVALCASFQR